MSKIMEDFTGDQGILNSAYSFEMPAHIVGNAILNGMMRAGLNQVQAINLFYSRAYRWELDGDLGQALEEIGYQAGINMANDWRNEAFLNDPLRPSLAQALHHHNEIERAYK